jgi:hypothetical protein
MSQQDENKTNKTGLGEKIALGSIVLAILGLLTAFVSNGGIDLIKPFILKSVNSQSPSSTAVPTSSAPSPISSTPSQPISSPSSSPSNPKNLTTSPVELNSANITLQSCDRSGKYVKCSLTMMSTQDREVGVGQCGSNTRTRIFDRAGNEYFATLIQFGGRDSNGCTVYTTLLQGVPTKIVLTFGDVPSEENMLTALEVSVRSQNEWEYSQHRNIPIR